MIPEEYKSDVALCKWLRYNSSGVYTLSGYAAERIEYLTNRMEAAEEELTMIYEMTQDIFPVCLEEMLEDYREERS